MSGSIDLWFNRNIRFERAHYLFVKTRPPLTHSPFCEGVHRGPGLRPRRSSQIPGPRWQGRERPRRQGNSLSSDTKQRRKIDFEKSVSGFQTSGVRFRLVEVNSRTFWESSSKSVFRANGKSFVCDVNGFSFVKNSNKYYDDCAKILGNMILRELAPTLHIPWSVPFQLDDPPIVPTTFGKMMELRCVVAVIRHGDRTPKQKMKVEVRHPKWVQIRSCSYESVFNREIVDFLRFLRNMTVTSTATSSWRGRNSCKRF